MSAAPVGRWLLMVAAVAIAATVAVAITVMGTPSQQREVRLDARRARDLNRIEDMIHAHVNNHGRLPVDLTELAKLSGVRLAIVDPVTSAPYAYRPIGERSFRICAVFTTDTAERKDESEPWIESDWPHGIGRQCFDRKIKGNGGD